MHIELLRGHGFSNETLRAWRGRGLRELLPLQQRALLEPGLLHGPGLLVSAPTASGKTFLAELAALRRLEAGRRVVYLAPTRALAEEKYRLFRQTYGPLGYRVEIATRERAEADRAVARGRFDLLVTVYEKWKAFLVAQPQLLDRTGLVVVDELQSLGEPGRGPALDALLTRMRLSPSCPSLLALSAVLGPDAAELAGWLGLGLLEDQSRPVPLREGYFDVARGVFVYRERGPGAAALGGPLEEEALAEAQGAAPVLVGGEEEAEALAVERLARALCVEREESLLFFVPTRRLSREWARRLAGRLGGLPAVGGALERLAGQEDSLARRLLEECLERGVGFHNADLGPALREAIESAFGRGELRLLVATSTLSQGVNLSARNVLQLPGQVCRDAWTGRQALAPLSRGRFRNQGGRAGRSAEGAPWGRSILPAVDAARGERLLRRYLEGEVEALECPMGREELTRELLDFVVSRGVCELASVEAFFRACRAHRAGWSGGSLSATVEEAVEILGAAPRPLLERQGGRVKPSGLGQACAGYGLDPAGTRLLADWLERAAGASPPGSLECLLALAATPDARGSGAGEAWKGPPAQWLEALRRRLDEAPRPGSWLAERLEPAGGLTREDFEDFRKALALEGWISEAETVDLERSFRIFGGALARLALEFAWLAQAAQALAQALGLVELAGRLERLAGCLALGAGPEALGLLPLRGVALTRRALRGLVAAGLASPQALAGAGGDELGRVLGASEAARVQAEARRLLERERRSRAEDPFGLGAEPSLVEGGLPAAPPPVEVSAEDGSMDDAGPTGPTPALRIDVRGAGRAWLDGRPLELPALAFRLLVCLARRGQAGASYQEIFEEVWPEAQVEPQQIHAHRKTLERAAARAGGGPLVELLRGRGLRLRLGPEAIRLEEAEGERCVVQP